MTEGEFNTRSEQRRPTAEELVYAAVMYSAPAAVALKDLEGRCLLVNRAWERLFGIPAERVRGRTDREALARTVFEALHAGEAAMSPGAPVQREVTVPLAGETRTLLSLPFGVLDAHGLLRGLCDILIDVSERKRAEEELRRNEQYYRMLADNALDMVAVVRPDGTMQYQNPAIERALGYRPEEVVGRKVSELVHPDDLPAVAAQLDKCIQNPGASATLEFRFRHKDGSWRLLEGIGRSLVHTPAVAGTLVSSRDITARKRAEAELRESREQLRALTARLFTAEEQERKALSRELHDDLSQWLAALAIEIGAMEGELPLPEASRSRLSALGRRIAELSDDVRRMAHHLRPSILDDLGLVPALRAYCTDFAKRERIRLRFSDRNVTQHLPPDVSLCLYRVAQEALRNVAKHSRATRATVRLAGARGLIGLTIRDDGVGFDPESIRTKGGLGIIGMKERVRLVNGSFTLNSRPGSGTRLEVRIPIGEAE